MPIMKDKKGQLARVPMHRERLGEWAAVLCIALLFFLVISIPVPKKRKAPLRPLPEPFASYVRVEFPHGFNGVLPHHGARRIDRSGGSFSLLPRPVLPQLPPVAGIPVTTSSPPAIPEWTASPISLAALPIEPPPPAFPTYGDNENTNSLSISTSKALEDIAFTFTPPPTKLPIRFTCTMDVGTDGHVRTLLMRGGKTPAQRLVPWRRAILSGHAKTNGCGEIRVEQRAPFQSIVLEDGDAERVTLRPEEKGRPRE